MPAAIALAIQGLLALLNAAPQVEAIATRVRDMFRQMAQAGLITAEVQNALDARVEADLALFRNGVVPPEYQVQPDPVAPSSL